MHKKMLENNIGLFLFTQNLGIFMIGSQFNKLLKKLTEVIIKL